MSQITDEYAKQEAQRTINRIQSAQPILPLATEHVPDKWWDEPVKILLPDEVDEDVEEEPEIEHTEIQHLFEEPQDHSQINLSQERPSPDDEL